MSVERKKSVWLVASRGRAPYELNLRMTQRRPSLKVGEIPLQVEVRIPSSLFSIPELKAVVTVPKRDESLIIDTEQISRAVSAATNLKIVVSEMPVEDPE